IEVVSVLLEATEKTQKPFLDRAIKNTYLNDYFSDRAKENVEKIIKEILQKGDPNLNISIILELLSHLKQLENNTSNVISGIINRLKSGELKFHSQNKNYYCNSNGGTLYTNISVE